VTEWESEKFEKVKNVHDETPTNKRRGRKSKGEVKRDATRRVKRDTMRKLCSVDTLKRV